MYGGSPYGGRSYGGSDVADIPQNDGSPALAVEIAFTTDALDSNPVFTDMTGDVRSWNVSRGRNRELERFQPGRATVVLGNLSRQYDSVNAAGPWFGNLKPMRRIRIKETFNGVTYPVFDGFIDRWKLDYPATGKDATATVTATDGFKVWARTDLPRSVYDDVVLTDAPRLYWRLDEKKNAEEDAGLLALNAGTLGSTGDGTYVGPPGLGGESLVVKDPGTSMKGVNSNQVAGNQNMGVFLANADFDLMAASFVVELWCIPEYEQPSNIWLWECDSPGGSSLVQLLRSDTLFTFGRTNSAATTLNLNSAGTEVNNKRYHIVCRHVFDEPMRMWINGVLFTGSTSTGAFGSDAPLRVGHPVAPAAPGGSNWQGPISHVAVYTGSGASVVDQTWVDRHYAAGTSPWNGDLPGARATRVLDLSEWPVSLRELDTGLTALQSAELGTKALEHLQKVGETEFGLFFVTRDGKARLVDRSALFGRDVGTAVHGDLAGEVGYTDFTPDDGDEVIRNRATISRLNGVARSTEDTAAIDEFGRFDYVLDGLLHDTDSYSQDYANLVVSQYKEPSRRITSLDMGPAAPGKEDEVYPAMLGPELGDVITVRSRPVGGGDLFEQVCAVEGIVASGRPGRIRATKFALSPEFPFRALEDEDVATLGYAQVTADQGSITTIVDLTSLTATVTVGTSRRVRITGYVSQFTRTAGTPTFVALDIYESTTRLNRMTESVPNTYSGAQCQVVLTPSAGSHTYKLRAETDGTVTMAASATAPAFILVEDIGSA